MGNMGVLMGRYVLAVEKIGDALERAHPSPVSSQPHLRNAPGDVHGRVPTSRCREGVIDGLNVPCVLDAGHDGPHSTQRAEAEVIDRDYEVKS